MKIKIEEKAYAKLRAYVDYAKGEISGVGKSTIDEDGEIIVSDFIIFKQTCTSGSTDIDDQAQAQFMVEVTKNGEDLKDWNIWWHSHASMGVFWSGTDNNTIESHIGTQPFLISIVANKKEEILARVDLFPTDTSPFKEKLITTYDDVDVEVLRDESTSVAVEELKNQIEEIEAEIERITDIEEKFADIIELCEKEVDVKVSGVVISTKGRIIPGFEYEEKYNDRYYEELRNEVKLNSRGSYYPEYESSLGYDEDPEVVAMTASQARADKKFLSQLKNVYFYTDKEIKELTDDDLADLYSDSYLSERRVNLNLLTS